MLRHFLKRLIAIGALSSLGWLMFTGWLSGSIDYAARSAQAQAAATAIPRLAITPVAGVPTTYTVKSGDSFNAIARQFNLTPQQLQALNAITNTSVIRVGQVLIVAVSTFTPTPPPTNTPAPTATPVPTETPTPAPSATATAEPTVAPTSTPAATDLPTLAAPVAAAPPAPRSIPIDVIVVGGVMLLALIGIIIGFRTQRF